MQLALVNQILGTARGRDKDINGAGEGADMVFDIYPANDSEHS